MELWLIVVLWISAVSKIKSSFFLATVSMWILNLLEAFSTDFQNCSSVVDVKATGCWWNVHWCAQALLRKGFQVLRSTRARLRSSAHLSLNRHLKWETREMGLWDYSQFSTENGPGSPHVKKKKKKKVVELCVQLSDLSEFGPLKSEG